MNFMAFQKKKKANLSVMIRYVFLIIVSMVMLFPLGWMITVALKSDAAVYAYPPQWIPSEFHWENFAYGTEIIDFWRKMINTVFITVVAVTGAVISNLFVGYALARIKFPGRKFWFYTIIASMMLPGMVSFLPVFKLYAAIGWYDTWLPMMIPSFFASTFFTFLMRQYFLSIPISFDEAAKIDGAGHLRGLFQILAPMSMPAIIVVIIGQAMATWNDYLTPLVYLVNPELWTLSLAVGQFTNHHTTSWNLMMATNLLYMIPMLLLFFFCQKYFMQGLGSLNSAALK